MASSIANFACNATYTGNSLWPGCQWAMLMCAEPTPSDLTHFAGQSYLLGFVLPNLYFHVATAYNILRHNGLVLAKPDFIGGL